MKPFACVSPSQYMDESNRRFEQALRQGDMQAIAGLFTQDAEILPAGAQSVWGRMAIQHYWKAAIQAGVRHVQLETLERELWHYAGVEIGVAYRRFSPECGAGVANYVIYWKQEKGAWQWHRVMWNDAMDRFSVWTLPALDNYRVA